MKRSWVEIDLSQLQRNYQIYKDSLPQGFEIMAVVKANAYGHGDVTVAQQLEKLGCRLFAVSNLQEAIRLRQANIRGEILIFGYTPTESFDLLIQYDITQAVFSKTYARALLEVAAERADLIKVQFAIDTGMSRIGFSADSPKETEETIRAYAKQFHATGIFTHLCVADGEDSESISFTKQQIQRFESLSGRLRDLNFPFVHCLNSAGGLYHSCKIAGPVRLGIVLYGLKPDASNLLPDGILPIMTWKSVVSMVKSISAGQSVGYGRTYMASRDMKIATIPTGYADGYSRALSNRGWVLMQGQRAPIVGRICMDQMMVDVSHIPDIKMGDEVVLLGKSRELSFTADDMAQIIGTIGYEIVCNVSQRVDRIYKE